jgi:tryptophanyl-tRNA synthetase
MRVVSGIRPSGELHIGNYLGAIKQWIDLQEKYECFFFIADLHVLTTPFEPKILEKEIKNTVISYLALGLNPEKAVLFVQSQISEHTELSWILGCLTKRGQGRTFKLPPLDGGRHFTLQGAFGASREGPATTR